MRDYVMMAVACDTFMLVFVVVMFVLVFAMACENR